MREQTRREYIGYATARALSYWGSEWPRHALALHGDASSTAALTLERITLAVRQGRNDMPAFGAALTPEQMQDLTAYVMQLTAKK